MVNKGLFTSLRDNWKTPKGFYEVLHREFDFNYDPCPFREQVADFDGLKASWGSRTFCNPPYGREIGKWIKKGYEENKQMGKLVVFLIPSRTDTLWWHNYVMFADEIRFIKGRLCFDDNKNPAPFPSAVVIFK